MKKRKINISNKDYEICLNRETVMWLEAKGFNLDALNTKPITMYSLLFESAFRANYPNVDASKFMDIYEEEDGDTKEVVAFLLEEYATFINALADTKSKKTKKMEIM